MEAPSEDALANILTRVGGAAETLAPVLELVLEHVADGIAITDETGETMYFNDAARQILALPKDANLSVRAQGASLFYLHDFNPVPVEELPLVRALRGEATTNVELFVRSSELPDGALLCLNAKPVRAKDGRVVGGVAVFHDAGARKRAEEELRAANAKLASWVAELERRARVTLLMNDMVDLLQSCRTMPEFYDVVSRFAGRIFDNESGAVYVVNASRSAMETVVEWGDVNRRERVHAPYSCWALRRGRMHRTGGESIGPLCSHAPPGKDGQRTICIPMLGQGEALGVLYVTEQAPDLEEPGELAGAMAESRLRTTIAVAEHIALALANLKLRETLRTQAIRDPLTNLFNRRHMEESLERELGRASRAGGSVSAVMIDLDHFKRFNDQFGHAAADLALRETAAVIRSLLRLDDIACRYGGEELVLILPDADAETAAAMAETLRAAVASQQVRYQGVSLGAITASFGVATFPGHASTSDGLLRAADESLYEAKKSGRNRVVVRAAGARKSLAPARTSWAAGAE